MFLGLLASAILNLPEHGCNPVEATAPVAAFRSDQAGCGDDQVRRGNCVMCGKSVSRSLRNAILAVAVLALHGLASAAADDRQVLVHGGLERTYVVRLPGGANQTGGKMPLVLVLHGGGGNALNAETMTGFTEKGRKEGVIVVYPEGTGRFGGKLLTWNAGHCCGPAMRNKVDDVGFISALLDKLIGQHPVDARRIYVTGLSNGGMLTHRIGIELSARIAAIAPVVATLFGDEKQPAHAVSALMINGALDKSVPVLGGPPSGRFPDAWDGTPAKPASEQGRFWAEADNCAQSPSVTDQHEFTRTRHTCAGGKSVESYVIKDGGHAWPGGRAGSRLGDTPSNAIRATDVIWDFFKVHSQ
jgi:polyhydroxybutyrate depolymerase